MQDKNFMPERIDDYVSQQFMKRYGEDPLTSKTRPVTKTESPALKGLGVEQVIASELDLLSKSGSAVTKQQIEKIMAKAGTSINKCCLCQVCMSKNSQNTKKTGAFCQTGEKFPINLNSMPEEFIKRFNPNPIQLCPEHNSPFDIIPKAAKDYAAEAGNIDFLIIDSGDWLKKEELEEINKNAENTNNPHRVIEYDYQFYFDGATKKRRMQALVFLDKEAFQKTHQRDRSEIEKQNFLRRFNGLSSIAEPVIEQPQAKREVTSQVEELLPEGAIEITKLVLKIKYAGKEYSFLNKTALLNSILELVGFGIKINPEDPSQIEFVDPKYIAQYGMAAEEKEEISRKQKRAISTVIAIDKRITGNIASGLEQILKTAENNPENRRIAGKTLSKNLFIES